MQNRLKEESNTVEYKRTLPTENVKWLKSIVAFSNTAGGKLIVGVEDSTLKVIGIKENRSELEQRIADAIYSSITPKPNIDIYFENINDKDVAVIRVSKGMETPYYLESLGLDEGCYVRYGSTDQKATLGKIAELRMNKKRESFTDCLYEENHRKEMAKKEDVDEFLKLINGRRKTPKNIDEQKLLEWNLIRKDIDETYVTNGYKLLTSNPFRYCRIRIGKFEGETKSILLKDEYYDGSIIFQYENVIENIMKELEDGFEIGRLREPKYKLPEVAVREVIANAIVHRNYLEEQEIRISIYNNRLEIFSPGTLFDGMQLEDALRGMSKLRNRNIAEIFYHLGVIEKWGSGIQRANKAMKENSLHLLEIDASNLHGITVIMKFEKNIVKDAEIIPNEEQYLVLKDSFSRLELEKDLNKTKSQARLIVEKWMDKGKIEKVGVGKATVYKVRK